ncbi:MAG: ferrous iron transport protein [Thermoproteota archaeon]|nr:ferrous iron transport protein [Thermoproteota archaeon]
MVTGATLIVPYVVPFYFILAMIEDSGILTRVAFMMDSTMHEIGLHGKALIPMILGYGCNVPAIRACRIMETKRERLLATFAITFSPCSARTIVILGLVAAFLGPWWALLLYAIDIALIFVLGKIALKVVPGQSTGLIMEMHSFKVPSLSVVSKQTCSYKISDIYSVSTLHSGKYLSSSFLRSRCFAISKQFLNTNYRRLVGSSFHCWNTLDTWFCAQGNGIAWGCCHLQFN